MERWSSRTGFILAAIGSAVGIGNVWRFSSVVGQNGGGAFLIPYLLAVLLFAVPLMILEMAVGRHFRADVVSCFGRAGEKFKILGWMICTTLLLILSYYLVITGWTMAYLVFSLLDLKIAFSSFTSSLQPVAYFLISVLATGVIVCLGVRAGIEKIVSTLIPFAFLILLILVFFSITLPGFHPGMNFFLSPDFSMLAHPSVWSAALGQAFFSLSVGMGILITYGAYLDDETDIPQSALVITIADLAVAMLAGAYIFSLVFTFGLEPTAGAELAFTTLPEGFELMPQGRAFSTAFFALLFSVAITSAISMMEVIVAAIIRETNMNRTKASIFLTVTIMLIGLPSCLSYSSVDLNMLGSKILDLMDKTVGTIGLPVAAFLVAVVFRWYTDSDILIRQVHLTERRLMLLSLLTKYAIPVALLIVTVSRFVGL